MPHQHHHNWVVLSLLHVLLVAIPLLPPASSSTTVTTTSPHGTLTISTTDNVTIVTINNPPLNLLDLALAPDLFGFLSSLDPSNRTTPPPKVVIFRSGNPDFFIAHVDVNAFITPFTPAKGALLSYYSPTLQLFQSLTTTIFIAEVDGRATAGGNEILMWMDMVFAGPQAHCGSIETSLGVTHGAGGMQYLARRIGKARALQYLLSGDSIDCQTGNKIGWFNGCFTTRLEMELFVEALAKRIALRPEGGLNATKMGLQDLNPPHAVIDADMAAYIVLNAKPVAQALFKKLLVLGKNQSLGPFELGLDATLAELYQ
ncbi:unnamed protein product [Calypogeia fissa]